MEQPTRRQRVSYAFDNAMSRGTPAIMGLLSAITLAFVLLMAVVVAIFRAFPGGETQGDFWDVVWGNLMRTLDPGTMGGDTGWGFRAIMLVVTIGGLIIVASLIGIVSGAFDDKMQQLRKGRSRVLERDHTLILGWSPQLPLILHELCEANASRKRSTIVVLADHDKVTMEDRIHEQVTDTFGTTIVFRTGDPMSPTDIHIGNPEAARSVIVLTDDAAADPDAAAIKTVLALCAALPANARHPHVVAALREPSNLAAAGLVSHGGTQWLLAMSLIHRLTAQTCRQAGLSTVYTELLNFSGNEIYFTEQPRLTSCTYREAQHRFATSTPIGIEHGDRIVLNPPPETVIEHGDRIIVIAEDDSTITMAEPGVPDPAAIAEPIVLPRPAEHTLVLGYHDSVPEILGELATYVPPGSTACVVAATPPERLMEIPGLEIRVEQADVTSRAVLDRLRVSEFDHILVLADRGQPDAQATDARTLMTLLQLRDMAERARLRLNIVSEMLDDRNRELAEVTQADDFIVSERLVGLMLAQASENPRISEVFTQLFSTAGSEIYLRPARLYVKPGTDCDFYCVVAAAAARGETAIGYQLAAHIRSSARGYGVHVNPDKTTSVRFGAADRIIVLAEQEG